MVNGNWKDGKKMLMVGLAIGVVLVCIVAVALVMLPKGPQEWPNSMKVKLTGNGTVSDDQVMLAKGVIEDRFKAFGYDALISPSLDGQGNAYLAINYGNISPAVAASIATMPGVFEMRVQTGDNQSAHILYGDDISQVSDPVPQSMGDGSVVWGVPLSLTAAGAQKFQQACIASGATQDPMSHNVSMLLDGQVFYSRPLSPDLAKSLTAQKVDQFMAMFGTGDHGQAMARELFMCLKGGTLPVRVEIVANDG